MSTSGSTRIRITSDVWIDGNSRVHRLKAHGALSGGSSSDSPSGGGDGRIDYELRQRDFNAKVTVNPPSPAVSVDINSVPGLLDAIKQSQSGKSSSSSTNTGNSDTVSS